VQALADLTGGKFKRTSISLYTNGKYPADVKAIEDAIRPLMTSRHCPFLTREITANDCLIRRTRPQPHQRGGQMFAHWQACQGCDFNTGD
jgi:hypothetical protein